MAVLRCGRYTLDLSRPRVMGILNVTPDSFSDGGRFHDRERALDHARSMAADGADVIDVGGESTRPGADAVPASEELARVLRIVATLASEGTIVSVDTTKPEVMREAVAAGASMINDVRALQENGALELAAATDAAIVLMHMRGTPRTMQQDTQYVDVVDDVKRFLRSRVDACRQAGITDDRLVIDPGFGFAKDVDDNLKLLHGLRAIVDLGQPVMVGLSRKSSLGKLTGRDAGDRLAASVAAMLAAVARGARLVRVHDVRETVDALAVWDAVNGAGGA